jgi:hypothetical protein
LGVTATTSETASLKGDVRRNKLAGRGSRSTAPLLLNRYKEEPFHTFQVHH